jgi:hypothetical protein
MCRHVVADFMVWTCQQRRYARRTPLWKGVRGLPLVYACEILAELRQWVPPKETFRIRKAREGC